MESVINFLADNYIWFFVAAGVLLFALVGFLIDSKKKKNSEFKGEAVENTVPVDYSVNDATPETTPENVGPVNEVGSVDEVSEVPNYETEPTNNNENPVSEPSNVDFTMQINDIPLAEPEEVHIEPTPVNTNLESVNESSDQIISEPVQLEPVNEELVQNTFETNNSILETPVVNNVEIPQNDNPVSNASENITANAEPEDAAFEIFDDLK